MVSSETVNGSRSVLPAIVAKRDQGSCASGGRRPTDQRRFNTSQIMKKQLDWQNLDIIRLFLLHREADFEEHIEEYGFSPSEAEDYREEVMQLLWDKMEEVL